MRYVTRELETEVQRAARAFPALILTGPRRSGKTSLLRHVFPDASYFLMEDPDIVSRLRDAQGLEVDFLVPGKSGRLTLVECKAARSVRPSDSSSLARVAAAIRLDHTSATPPAMYVVHQPAAALPHFEVLAPEAKAVSVVRLLEEIS